MSNSRDGTPGLRRIAFEVSGRVQGVSFRWFTKTQAEALGLGGWVRNRPDGRVDGELVGEAQAIEELLGRLRVGPATARVVDLRTEDIPTPEDEVRAAPRTFEIRTV